MKVRVSVLLVVAAGLTAGACRSAAAQSWLEETFDGYTVGPLDGQGAWTGNTQRVCVVSTVSLAGNAVCCDVDENPMLPVVWQVQRPVAVPNAGQHVLSFAVRVETPTPSFASQAALILASIQTPAIELAVSPVTADMFIRNDFVDCYWVASWDLGTMAGGNPDLTTGTFHVFELDLDFGKADDVMDDFVRDVRLDGHSQAGMFSPDFPAYICLQYPMDRLTLDNGTAIDDTAADAVFFDSVIGRPAALSVRHWHLY